METSDFAKNLHPVSFGRKFLESRGPPLQCVLKGRMSLQIGFHQGDRSGDFRGRCSTQSASECRRDGVPTDAGNHESVWPQRMSI